MKTTDTASSKEPKAKERRAFLRLAGTGVAAGGIAVVAMGGEAVEAEASVSRQDAGYRETDHVKRFYAAARF